MYKVTFEGSFAGQKFLFRNYDDALQFASLAMESGEFADYEYDAVNKVKIWEEPHPIQITLQGVEE